MAKTYINGYSDQISVKTRRPNPLHGERRRRHALSRRDRPPDQRRRQPCRARPQGGSDRDAGQRRISRAAFSQLTAVRISSWTIQAALLNVGQSITVHAFIMPTTPAKGVQGIITRCDPERRMGWALVIDEQQAARTMARRRCGASGADRRAGAIEGGLWYSAGASYDGATGRAIVHLAPVHNAVNSLVGRVAMLPPACMHAATAEPVNFHSQSAAVIAGWAGRHGCLRSHHRGRPLQRQNRSPARLRACARRSATRRTRRGPRTGQPRADRAMGLR